MNDIAATLAHLGLILPPPPAAGGNYLPFRRSGNILYLAGAISVDASGVVTTGRVGAGRTVEEGYAAARLCTLNLLSVIQSAIGSLEGVAQVLTVNGYVNAVEGFPNPPLVINGASDLLVAVFGEAGRHARAAIGVSSLPKDALVEVQMTVELK